MPVEPRGDGLGNLTTDAVPDAPRRNVTELELTDIGNSGPSQKNKSPPAYSQDSKANSKREPRPHSQNRIPQNSQSHACTSVINVVNSNGVHVGAVNNYNLFPNKGKKGFGGGSLRLEVINKMVTSTELVSREHVNLVATHLGAGWRAVGAKLGYSAGQMDHFYSDNKEAGDKEVVYQMLLDWTRVRPDDCRISKLAQILWDLDELDVLRRWADIL